MFRNRSVDVHKFAMVPRADIPRSSFKIQTTHKTAFDAGYLVPVFTFEVLPGDTVGLNMTAFARMATPLFPVMDNLYLDSFFFFVPYRLIWTNWQRFMGERDPDPDSSTSYTIPQMVTPTAGYTIGSLQDYFGLPTVGQVDGSSTVSHSALPIRAYAKIFNDWFRDENLQDSVTLDLDDGPDTYSDYTLLRRGKRHDYFTSALPWPQKSDSAVSIPLGTSAPVRGIGIVSPYTFASSAAGVHESGDTTGTHTYTPRALLNSGEWVAEESATSGYPNIYADLSEATAATINQLRQSFATQKLLERDARGGTRYTEIVRAHFGVVSPDARLQRAEYLGGGSVAVNVNPIAQTSATDITGSATPVGTLAAMGTAVGSGGFRQSFTEHGIVIGLVNVRADLTYQQGLERFWSRSTRYDFYWPAFATIGEQSILNKEIFCDGTANDDLVFGYAERWGEYRYKPSMITSLFRSTASGSIDAWHLAQEFSALPTLNTTFIQDTPPLSRVLAVGAAADGQQFIFDSFFDINAVRPLPMYSVPGLIDHF